MGKVIAIDGPSGAGKGTIAKLLAAELGFSCLDTGALYRAAALALREKGINPEDSDEKIASALKGISIAFKDGRVFLKENSEVTPPIPPLPRGGERGGGGDVSELIRSTEIGHYSSVFSARKVVRDFLLDIQRSASLNADLVAEGRDMTTVVFPEAWKKFYLDASVEERARRRYLQLKEKGINITESEAEKDVVERDARDSGRDLAPLRKADDAVLIDSSRMTINEVLENILKVVRGDH
ncbi:MAG: cytidylate kinase [Nitrospirae bacterium CG_4_10_14_3_um_filter_44_29]|nr:(d)CMP kinase [Nitrospirota bacterium]OIO29556.1 MAG: cytidylate kinase [Nitrospirae bacterium CG1_02_44_142]PIP71375.1 MAG: cytidylate kinase [Nitrospirae bacterium CG22_combo_CG10-13_8_21_14_all_44_11]PIV40538.1 MAG: cytidylate kinase [Nitrospirae bacterium CG02_land_8_20_14_3_00_44_33]PIV66128.1 MAG: cytidylate kinase [Nitrospirae bacterium CG01_land_8_20_14_3_00_44_22]PIW88910.1 MAG: cytidylate kinase [Nitrospirae bacterium CG_4_8_14_3_um_filter_44_28]PIX88938.1 MAG: cytidylate kinase 